MREEVIKQLMDLQDLKYREFHSGLCPSTYNIIGVRIPEQRKIAKRLIKDNFQKFLMEVKNEFYEETMIEGMVIAMAPMALQDRLECLRKFVPKIDNWAVCDSVCASFKVPLKERSTYWDFILTYRGSVREFELRFMLIMMLDHFLDGEHLQRIFTIIDTLQTEAYYANMATAWLVAEAFTKHRDETLKFLQDDHLSKFTHNKAIQKACESYRVDADDKILLRSMKR